MPATATPTVIVTLDPATGTLRAELPGPAGRRKLTIAPSKLEETLLTVLTGMSFQRHAIGEDGAPTQSQVRHWERHAIWSDPQCPHCIGEGRFVGKKVRDRKITKADAAALALRARGYAERAPGRWYKLGFETAFVTRTGVVSSPNRRWPSAEVARLREEGQREANLRQYTSPCFRTVAVLGDSEVVVRHAKATKAQREAATTAKLASIEITF